jgi:hypothetical protein
VIQIATNGWARRTTDLQRMAQYRIGRGHGQYVGCVTPDPRRRRIAEK